MIEKIVHTAKQIVNENVERQRARVCAPVGAVDPFIVVLRHYCVRALGPLVTEDE